MLEKIAYYRNARQELRRKLYALYRDAWDRKQPIEAPLKGGLLYRFYKKVKKRLIIRKRAIRAKKRAALAHKFMRLQVEKSKDASATRIGVHAGDGKGSVAPMIVSRRSFMPATAGVATSFGAVGGQAPAADGGADGKLFSADRFMPASVVAVAENLTKQRGGTVASAFTPEAALSSDAQGLAVGDDQRAARAVGKGSSGPDEQARRRALLKSHRERQGLPQPETSLSPDQRDRRASLLQQEVLSSSSSESEDSSDGDGEEYFDDYGNTRLGGTPADGAARDNGNEDDDDADPQERERERRQSLQIAHAVISATARADGRRRKKNGGSQDARGGANKQPEVVKFVSMFKNGAEASLRRTRVTAPALVASNAHVF